MSQGIENIIEQHIKKETKIGHFELTFNEIKGEIDTVFSRGNVIEALVRMEGKKILSTRMKGKTKLYFLSELQEMCRKAW